MQPKRILPLAFAALAAAAQSLNTVLQANNDSLSTFNSLLAMVPAVSKTLSNGKDMTVLAPSNDAFAKRMEMDPVFAQQTSNVTFVAELLKYHVFQGKTMASMFSSTPKFAQSMLETAAANVTGNQKVGLVKKGDQVRIFSGYKQMSVVTKADIAFTGSVLHVVDSVLTFPGTPIETAMNTGLTSMAGALMRAKLVDGVDSLQAATIFAPTNAAFQAIGATVAAMEPQDLAKILQYHLLSNQVRFSSGVTTKMAYKSLMGVKVTLRKENNVLFANSAKVTTSDIITSDGVIHVIDNVLNPASPKLNPSPSADTSKLAFQGAVAAANAPFTDGVRPTANFSPASSTSRSFGVSLNSAILGFVGCLAVVYL